MSDLLVTSVTPNLKTGRGLRTYGVTAALARRGAVEVAYKVFDGFEPAPEYARLESVSTRRLEPSRGGGRAVCSARAWLRGVPAYFARGVSPELIAAASAAPAGERVIADGPVVAAALMPLARVREVVYLAHNLESGFRDNVDARRLARFEKAVLHTFAQCWMPTRADARAAAELGGPQVDAHYVPNVIDLNRVPAVTPAGAGRVLFVADFTYAPNREALGYLSEQVLPLAWRRRSDLRVSVVGRGLSADGLDERIEVAGFVEDLAAAYAAADVVAVPLLRGGGSPFKLIEGLASGLPVVATRHAADLLEDPVDGEHLLVASDAGQFAQALERALTDEGLARRLGAQGRELAKRCYSIEALATLLRR